MLLSLQRVNPWRDEYTQQFAHLLLLGVVSFLLGPTGRVEAQEAITMKPLECYPGFYYHQVKQQCLACLQGTYKETQGPHPCVYCPKDTDGRNATTLGDRATSIDNCYFRTYMKSFYPLYGPMAGGTRLNITLGYLTDQIWLRTWISGLKATTNCTRNGSSYLCSTPPSDRLRSGPVKMELMDSKSEYQPKSSYNFTYKLNPTIESVHNLSTFLSGGILITVTGTHLNSVAHPEMILTRVYKMNNTRHFYSICNVDNSTMMQCPTPNITEIGIRDGSYFSEDFRIRQKRQTQITGNPDLLNSDDLQYFIGFSMDGLQNVGGTMDIAVYKDPIFKKFVENHWLKYFHRSRETHVLIKGERLDYSVTIKDIRVFIGEGDCYVTELLTNQLTCLPPTTHIGYGQHGPGPEGSHHVQVVVGNLRYHIGYLKYVDEEQVERTIILGMSIIGAILLWVIVLFVVVVWWQRRHHNAEKRKRKSSLAGNKLPQESSSSRNSSSSSEAGDYLFAGNSAGSSENSEGTVTTGVPSLEVDVEVGENPQMMHIDIWSVLEEPLKSKVKECQIDSHRLTLGDCIGVGSFGRVFKGEMDMEDGSKVPVAVKTLRDGFTSAEELPQFLEEGLVMAGFKHHRILPLYGVAVSDCLPFVVSEYMDLGDLRSYVKSATEESLTVDTCLGLSLQVAEGMVYLSQQGFLHRDLAARNCLINSNGEVKIGDFGLSRDLHGQDYYRVGDMGRPLPVKWMAIESLNLGKFSTKSDVWSFGVVMWELLTKGRTPYYNVHNIDLKDYINNNNRLFKPFGAPDSVYEIMQRCWKTNPADRPAFTELVISISDVRNIMVEQRNSDDNILHSDPEVSAQQHSDITYNDDDIRENGPDIPENVREGDTDGYVLPDTKNQDNNRDARENGPDISENEHYVREDDTDGYILPVTQDLTNDVIIPISDNTHQNTDTADVTNENICSHDEMRQNSPDVSEDSEDTAMDTLLL